MMLDEAIANWKQEERRALVDAAAAKTVADMDRIVLRLDAAVRDVALAAGLSLVEHTTPIWIDGHLAYCDGESVCPACKLEMELARQFGLPEGSEKEGG